jgi:4-aminobenzoate N-oxygenase
VLTDADQRADHRGGPGMPAGAGPGIGMATLRRIAAAWPERAAVRRDPAELAAPPEFDAGLPDYPPGLVPFAGHPRFLAASPAQRQQVLTGMWLGYNERVIATEALIAEPAFGLIMAGTFPGGDDPVIRLAVQQARVDESYHTYLHMLAISRTSSLRQAGARPPQPPLVTYRRLREVLDAAPEAWERDLAVLAWGAVAETSINALLALIARDRDVQPMHALITTLHLRDESAHGSVVIEVVKALHEHMNQAQRRALARYLPLALRAFSEQDPLVLRSELARAGVAGADEIVGDLRGSGPAARLVRDYSGAARLVRELGLADQVEFEFPPEPEWAAQGTHLPPARAAADSAGR